MNCGGNVSQEVSAFALVEPCNAERGCAGKQRRYVSYSSANISTIFCPDTPWSSKMFVSSRSSGEARHIGARGHLEKSSQGGERADGCKDAND